MTKENENYYYFADGEFHLFDFINLEWDPIRALTNSIDDLFVGGSPPHLKDENLRALFYLLEEKVSKVDSIFQKIADEEEEPKVKQKES